MPIAFMPSRGIRSSNARARPYNGRSMTRGRVVARRAINMRNHLVVMLTTVASCVLLSAFLIYDIVRIYQFFSEQNAIWRSDITSMDLGNTTTHVNVEGILKKMDNYNRQRALAATLMVLLILQATAGVCVYVGFEKKIRYLLVGYLVMTFPVMTFAMVYAIIFMVDASSNYQYLKIVSTVFVYALKASSTFVYVKIVTVILVYTIQANMYRLVYRLYQSLKYDARRAQNRNGENNNAFNEERRETHRPVTIQLKPPPYEKEPPPYSVEVPSVHQPLASPNNPYIFNSQINTPASVTAYNTSQGASGVNPSVFDFSPESIQHHGAGIPSRLTTSSLSYGSDRNYSLNGINRNTILTSSNSMGALSLVETTTPPYTVVENSNVIVDNSDRENMTSSLPNSISVVGISRSVDTNASVEPLSVSIEPERTPIYSVTLEPIHDYGTDDTDLPPPYSEI